MWITPVPYIKKIIQGKTEPSPKPAGQGGDAWFHRAFDLCCLTLLLATLRGQGNCLGSPTAYWFLHKGQAMGIVMEMAEPRRLERWSTPLRRAQARARLPSLIVGSFGSQQSANQFHPMKTKVNVRRPHHLYYNLQLYWNFPGRAEILMFNLLELMRHKIPIYTENSNEPLGGRRDLQTWILFIIVF